MFYAQKIPHVDKFRLIAKLRRCWYPRHCAYSGKFLWLRKAYRLETDEYDFQDRYKVYAWVEKETYLIKKLKGEL